MINANEANMLTTDKMDNFLETELFLIEKEIMKAIDHCKYNIFLRSDISSEALKTLHTLGYEIDDGYLDGYMIKWE